MSVYLYEGQTVSWVGGGIQARGHIVEFGGADSAHVKWATGPNAGTYTLADVYDLEPVMAGKIDLEDDPMHFTAVAKAYSSEGEQGVLNFLATNKYLDGWQKIATDVLEFTQSRIRTDASMELVEEQLSPADQRSVIQAAALALLHDAFGSEDE
jgi:hypothetical protein